MCCCEITHGCPSPVRYFEHCDALSRHDCDSVHYAEGGDASASGECITRAGTL